VNGAADAHEDAFGRQRDVHDLGEVHLEDGQEEFHGRTADVELEAFARRITASPGWKSVFFARYTACQVPLHLLL
jgi:hypothetical protein